MFRDMYPPLVAGITGYVHDVAERSASEGHEVQVVTTGAAYSEQVLPAGTRVHRHRQFGRLMACPVSPSLVAAAARQTADVMHLHMPCPTSEVGVLANRGRVPLVVTFHAQLGRQKMLEPFYSPLRRAVLARAATVLVSNPGLARAPELLTAAGRVEVNPFGLSPRLRPSGSASERDEVRAGLRLLFVGRLVYYKGIDLLIRALARAGEVPVLTVVGDGPMRPALERLVVDLGVERAVTFLGRIDDDRLRSEYGSHDVFVLPSVSSAEAFGLAMVEAMAHGLPAISTELGTGTSWVNLDGETGLVVPAGDPDALADAIRKLADGSLRGRLAAGARSRAETTFGFERHWTRLHEVYEAACASR